jgi:hypothetical protein
MKLRSWPARTLLRLDQMGRRFAEACRKTHQFAGPQLRSLALALLAQPLLNFVDDRFAIPLEAPQ